MPTLVLPPRRSDDTETLRRAAEGQGWAVAVAPGYRLPERWEIDAPVLYGDVLFCDVAAGPLGLALIEPSQDWLTRIPTRYLRRPVRFTTLAKARVEAGPLFAKPADDKCFPATVYPSGGALPDTDLLPDETPVLLSEPVTWETEFRAFVRERALETLSIYSRYGELAQDAHGDWPATSEERDGATAFLVELLADADAPLPPAAVVDVGYVQGRGWTVVEANPVWGSGVYGCDPAAVLRTVARASVPRAALIAEDSRWTRPYREIEY